MTNEKQIAKDYDNAKTNALREIKALTQRLADLIGRYDGERSKDYGHIGSLNKIAFDMKNILNPNED